MPLEGANVGASFNVTCHQIQKLGNPKTLIRSSGPRRQNVAPTLATPDSAYANPTLYQGQEVTWTGKLKRIRGLRGQVHLVVDLIGSKNVSSFEAFTTDRTFVTQLEDYVTNDESTSGDDTVSVTGTIALPEATGVRLSKYSPLLQLKQIEKVGVPTSKAEVGKKREENSFAKQQVTDSLFKLLRNTPPIGTEVTLQVRYSSFSESSKQITVNPLDRNRYLSVHCDFPAGSKTAFEDYKINDHLHLVAVIREDGLDTNSGLKLQGKRVYRLANRRSEVTETGRAIPPLDFTQADELWSKVQYNNDPVRDPLLGGGEYDGYAINGTNLNIKITKAFFKYSSITLTSPNTVANRQALDRFKSGEEILFEGTVQPKGMLSTRPVAVIWLAPIGSPNSKETFDK
jgi:hypothetical protein